LGGKNHPREKLKNTPASGKKPPVTKKFKKYKKKKKHCFFFLTKIFSNFLVLGVERTTQVKNIKNMKNTKKKKKHFFFF